MDDSTTVQRKATSVMCGCDTAGAGHNVLAVQQIVAAASPSAWVDALVVATEGTVIILTTLEGEQLRLWHHDALPLADGEPVALHRAAGLLAAQGHAINIRTL